MGKEEPILRRRYHIPLAMFDDAFKRFQHRYVFPKNIVVSVILLALAAEFVRAVLVDRSQTFSLLLVVVCVALTLITWYNTLKLRRTVHNGLKDIENDLYEIEIYEDRVIISTRDCPNEIPVIADSPPETDEEEEPETPQEPEEPEKPQEPEGNGFREIFPDKPKETAPEIEPTEIKLGEKTKTLEYPEYFMIYLVRQTFYVLPKKDLSEEEAKTVAGIFARAKEK